MYSLALGVMMVGKKWSVLLALLAIGGAGHVSEINLSFLFPSSFGSLFLVGCFIPVILLVQHALLLSRSIDTHIIFSPRSVHFNQFLPRYSLETHFRSNPCET
jgi:hypothetical protein